MRAGGDAGNFKLNDLLKGCLVQVGNGIELQAVGFQFESYRWRPCGVTWDFVPHSRGNKAAANLRPKAELDLKGKIKRANICHVTCLSRVRTIPLPLVAFASVVPLWCDLGCCSHWQTVVVLKLRRTPAFLSSMGKGGCNFPFCPRSFDQTVMLAHWQWYDQLERVYRGETRVRTLP